MHAGFTNHANSVAHVAQILMRNPVCVCARVTFAYIDAHAHAMHIIMETNASGLLRTCHSRSSISGAPESKSDVRDLRLTDAAWSFGELDGGVW